MGAGLDLDDAAVASEVFASKKFKIATVEQLSTLKTARIDDILKASTDKDMSYAAEDAIRAFWEKSKLQSQVIQVFQK